MRTKKPKAPKPGQCILLETSNSRPQYRSLNIEQLKAALQARGAFPIRIKDSMIRILMEDDMRHLPGCQEIATEGYSHGDGSQISPRVDQGLKSEWRVPDYVHKTDIMEAWPVESYGSFKGTLTDE